MNNQSVAQKTVSCPTCRRDVPVADMVRVKGLAKTEEEICAAEPVPQEEGEAAIKVVGSYGTKVSLFLPDLDTFTIQIANITYTSQCNRTSVIWHRAARVLFCAYPTHHHCITL